MTSDETSEIRPGPPPVPTAAAHTTPLPALASHSRPAPRVALVFVAVAAAGVLVGIAGASALRTPAAKGPVLAEADVGPSGQTLDFSFGQIKIPDGAVSQPVHVVVRRSYQHGVRIGTVDSTYSFEPTEVTFQRDVEIVFRFRSGQRNGAVVEMRGDGVTVLGGDVDAERGTVTIKVRSFRFGGEATG